MPPPIAIAKLLSLFFKSKLKVGPGVVKVACVRDTGDFRHRLAGNSADFKELARDLYDLLLQPVQTELEGKDATEKILIAEKEVAANGALETIALMTVPARDRTVVQLGDRSNDLDLCGDSIDERHQQQD